MTTSTYSEVNRMQPRTIRQHRLAVALGLVGLTAISITTLVQVGPVNRQITANVPELTQTHVSAPAWAEFPARPR